MANETSVECTKYKSLAEHDGCSQCFAFREREREALRTDLRRVYELLRWCAGREGAEGSSRAVDDAIREVGERLAKRA